MANDEGNMGVDELWMDWFTYEVVVVDEGEDDPSRMQGAFENGELAFTDSTLSLLNPSWPSARTTNTSFKTSRYASLTPSSIASFRD